MIRPLRIRHRRVFTMLGLFLPVAFGLGIAARKPVPVVANLPAEFKSAFRLQTGDWEQTDIFTNVPVYVHTLRQSKPGSRRAIALSAEPSFVKPDLLVYWCAGKLATSARLPEGAVLLGTFTSPELRLPEEANTREGAIILYSLADSDVVAISRSVTFNAPVK